MRGTKVSYLENFPLLLQEILSISVNPINFHAPRLWLLHFVLLDLYLRRSTSCLNLDGLRVFGRRILFYICMLIAKVWLRFSNSQRKMKRIGQMGSRGSMCFLLILSRRRKRWKKRNNLFRSKLSIKKRNEKSTILQLFISFAD